MRRKWIFIAPAALVGMTLFIFIGGEVVKLLWNWLLPPLFGWRQLTFWEALGLLALCRILFGGFGGHGRSYHPDPGFVRARMGERMADRMADRFAERWDRMTPDERDRFRQRVRERCGFDPAGGETKVV
ncbi:MAG TPA: hypothetical protein VH497_13895 [Vicinamibacterales bacterium]|jgi:hypothetical protein